jgi:hypothetical protein
MDTAIGSVGEDGLFRSSRLSLFADGLKPHTISCYIRDAERFLFTGRTRAWFGVSG